ncbi:MAG: InlB B-repeat-containing protein [Parasporobacterium sp.]|nr:InlB B-repeat-containing protein [Parasporobacterium sp.]
MLKKHPKVLIFILSLTLVLSSLPITGIFAADDQGINSQYISDESEISGDEFDQHVHIHDDSEDFQEFEQTEVVFEELEDVSEDAEESSGDVTDPAVDETSEETQDTENADDPSEESEEASESAEETTETPEEAQDTEETAEETEEAELTEDPPVSVNYDIIIPELKPGMNLEEISGNIRINNEYLKPATVLVDADFGMSYISYKPGTITWVMVAFESDAAPAGVTLNGVELPLMPSLMEAEIMLLMMNSSMAAYDPDNGLVYVFEYVLEAPEGAPDVEIQVGDLTPGMTADDLEAVVNTTSPEGLAPSSCTFLAAGGDLTSDTYVEGETIAAALLYTLDEYPNSVTVNGAAVPIGSGILAILGYNGESVLAVYEPGNLIVLIPTGVIPRYDVGITYTRPDTEMSAEELQTLATFTPEGLEGTVEADTEDYIPGETKWLQFMISGHADSVTVNGEDIPVLSNYAEMYLYMSEGKSYAFSAVGVCMVSVYVYAEPVCPNCGSKGGICPGCGEYCSECADVCRKCNKYCSNCTPICMYCNECVHCCEEEGWECCPVCGCCSYCVDICPNKDGCSNCAVVYDDGCSNCTTVICPNCNEETNVICTECRNCCPNCALICPWCYWCESCSAEEGIDVCKSCGGCGECYDLCPNRQDGCSNCAEVYDEDCSNCRKTVTFNSCGGTEIADVQIPAGKTIEAPETPKKSGYNFIAWYADEKYTDKWDFETRTVESDITLYALWECVHTEHAVFCQGFKAKCETPGQKDYYECTCGLFFEDKECTKVITEDIDEWKVTEPLGHVWSETYLKENADTSNHYHVCERCSAKDAGEAHVPGPEATETTPQLCTICSYVIKPAIGHIHKGTLVQGFEAKCEKAGQKDYYECECGKFFEDAACTKEITEDIDTWKVIPAAGHKDNSKDGKCDECGKVIEYLIIEGENQSFTKGSATDIVIRCNGEIEYFMGVQVDGADLAADNYTAVSGSTILTLKKSYTDTLSVGTHKVKLLYNDASVETDLIVKAAPVDPVKPDPSKPSDGNAPKTGDSNNMALWFMLMIVSAACIVSCVITIRRRKHSK